ncbi:MAG: mandelate racemase/muconate lactonizing enzyme family protein [SAR202 cluster bacterium]|nr:mandelate racemase/muconate lactonizing enzyme family protein [SAR202 cluster bacterium]
MKITGVKTFLADGGVRPWTFVKVETDDGVVGWGDCTEWDVYRGVTHLVDEFSERVIGKDPMNSEKIWYDLMVDNVRHNGGLAWKAMAGIDNALWDIKGKVLGVPVWQLLGGKLHDELRLYWSHCGTFRNRWAKKLGTPPVQRTGDLKKLSEEVLAKGFTAIKTNLMPLKDLPSPGSVASGRIGGHASPDQIRNAVGLVETFRAALGPDVGIAVDIALRFKLGGAIDIARALEPYNLMWLETETFDPGSLRTVRESTRTRICTGESLYGLDGYRPFLERYAQDVIMPDFAWNGITMGRKICDLAQAYDTFVAPHNCHSPICTLVSANVMATCPNFMILEFDQDDPPWRDDFLTHPFTVKNGYLKVPDRPGLGSDLVERELRKRPWNG